MALWREGEEVVYLQSQPCFQSRKRWKISGRNGAAAGGELRVRRRKPAQAPPRLLMREFPTTVAANPGSEQGLDIRTFIQTNLFQSLKERKKNLFTPPALASLADCGFLLLSQSQADWWHCRKPTGRTRRQWPVTVLLSLVSFHPVSPRSVWWLAERQSAGSSRACSPPLTWTCGASPWRPGWFFPAATLRWRRSAGHWPEDVHPVTGKYPVWLRPKSKTVLYSSAPKIVTFWIGSIFPECDCDEEKVDNFRTKLSKNKIIKNKKFKLTIKVKESKKVRT